jgi:hypothetical protein
MNSGLCAPAVTRLGVIVLCDACGVTVGAFNAHYSRKQEAGNFMPHPSQEVLSLPATEEFPSCQQQWRLLKYTSQ